MGCARLPRRRRCGTPRHQPDRRTLMSSNVDVVLQTIRAVEQRDAQALFALYHPELEMHDAPSLPYGGTRSGLNDIGEDIEHHPERTWLGTWGPLQPTEAERRM